MSDNPTRSNSDNDHEDAENLRPPRKQDWYHHGQDPLQWVLSKPLPPTKQIPKTFSLTSPYQNPQPSGQNWILNLPIALIADYQFNGTYSRYLEFASLVQTFVDSDTNLSDYLKYSCLLKLTYGEANRIISGIFGDPTHIYSEAKRRLEYRYYQPALIQQSLIDNFITRNNYSTKEKNKHITYWLLRFNSDAERILKFFHDLEADDEWMIKVLNMILICLPQDIRQKYRQEYTDIAPKMLLNFINECIQRLQTLEYLEHENSLKN